jgi:KaiC/GvpD/RAD55 family RecA-like ATPase
MSEFDSMASASRETIKTYVRGLDERIEGGIPHGHVVLLCGPSGSMKSSFSCNIAYNHVREKKGKCLYVSLEQSRNSLVRQMTRLGMNLEQYKDEFTILDLSWLRKTLQDMKDMSKEQKGEESIDWLQATDKQIKSYKDILNYNILILDSLEALLAIGDLKNPRNQLFHLFESLRDLKLTSFVISEMESGSQQFGKFGIEAFLADGIIHLDMERSGRNVGRFIRIVKMREVNHSSDYFPLIVDRDGFKIVTK